MHKFSFDLNASDTVRTVLSDEDVLKFTFNIQFAKCLIEQRTHLGWTQEMLAEKSGVNRVTIAKIEKLQRQVGVDVMIKLLDAMGLTIKIVSRDDT